MQSLIQEPFIVTIVGLRRRIKMDEKRITIGLTGTLIMLQLFIFLLDYFFELGLPWYVVWFPFLVYGFTFLVLFVILLFLLLVLVAVFIKLLFECFRG